MDVTRLCLNACAMPELPDITIYIEALEQLGAGAGGAASRKNMPPIVSPDQGGLSGDKAQSGRNSRREGRQ